MSHQLKALAAERELLRGLHRQDTATSQYLTEFLGYDAHQKFSPANLTLAQALIGYDGDHAAMIASLDSDGHAAYKAMTAEHKGFITPSKDDIKKRCALVEAGFLDRSIREAGHQARAKLDAGEDPATVLAEIESLGKSTKVQTSAAVDLSVLRDNEQRRLDDIVAGKKPDDLTPTGIEPLDNRLGGGYPPGIINLVGIPGSGKTVAALQCALEQARYLYENKLEGFVGIFEADSTSSETVLRRMAASLAQINLDGLAHFNDPVWRTSKYHRHKIPTLKQIGVFRDYLDYVERLPIALFKDGGDPKKINAKLKPEINKWGPLKVVVFDHIKQFEPYWRKVNLPYQEYVDQTFLDIKNEIQDEMGFNKIPMLFIQHLNKDTSKREYPLPRQADINFGGWNPPDLILAIFRPAQYMDTLESEQKMSSEVEAAYRLRRPYEDHVDQNMTVLAMPVLKNRHGQIFMLDEHQVTFQPYLRIEAK